MEEGELHWTTLDMKVSNTVHLSNHSILENVSHKMPTHFNSTDWHLARHVTLRPNGARKTPTNNQLHFPRAKIYLRKIRILFMDVTYFCFYLRVTRPDGCDSATHLDFVEMGFRCSTSANRIVENLVAVGFSMSRMSRAMIQSSLIKMRC